MNWKNTKIIKTPIPPKGEKIALALLEIPKEKVERTVTRLEQLNCKGITRIGKNTLAFFTPPEALKRLEETFGTAPQGCIWIPPYRKRKEKEKEINKQLTLF